MELEELLIRWGRAARPEPITTAITGKVVLMGWAIRETTGVSPATVVLRDGQDGTGMEIMGANLNPSGAARDWFGPEGISTDIGLFPVITGAVAGSMWIHAGRN